VRARRLQAALEIPVVSTEDLYGGKLGGGDGPTASAQSFRCSTAHEGITVGSRRAFVVYLASHNRPVHEVLFPSLRDIRQEFEHNFTGVTAEPVELDAHLPARDRMTRELQQGLSADERRFLLAWSPQNLNGRCSACRIWTNFPAHGGGRRTSKSCRRPVRENLPSSRTRSRGCSGEECPVGRQQNIVRTFVRTSPDYPWANR
jgi:hypothetical protein